MIRIKSARYNKKRKGELVKDAIKHSLHLGPFGLMEGWLESKVETIILAYDGETPVAALVYTGKPSYYNLGTFVMPKYQKQGIGTKLVKTLKRRYRGESPNFRYNSNKLYRHLKKEKVCVTL